MVVFVDFNAVREGGLVTASLPRDFFGIEIGNVIVAADGEGTECDARVEDIRKGYEAIPYAVLSPLPGSFRDSEIRLTSDQVHDFLKVLEL